MRLGIVGGNRSATLVGLGLMSVRVSTPVRAEVSDAPKPALEVNPPKLSGWSRAFLVLLLTIQIAWAAALLYAGYRVIRAIGGIL